MLTWVVNGQIQEVEIELMGAAIGPRGRSVTYQIQMKAGDALPPVAEQVSLFIDMR